MLIFLFACAVSASAAVQTCSTGLRGEGPDAAAAKIQTATRAGAGDPCPDHAAEGSDEEQSELLDRIREKTLPRLDQMVAKQIDPPTLRKNYEQMRLLMAMRGARVRLDPQRKLVVVPSDSLAHDGDLGSVDPLSDVERHELNAQIAARVDDANLRFTRDPRAGKDLLDALNREGRLGYQKLIAEDPALLYVDSDLDVNAARDAYRADLRKGREDLAALATRPPTGAAVGMIYFGPGAADAVRARPELCGAFHSLLKKAGGMKRAQTALSWMVTPFSLCGARGATKTKLFSLARVRALLSPVSLTCAAVGYATSYAIAQLPSTDFKRQQLLYGVEPGAPAAGPALTAEVK